MNRDYELQNDILVADRDIETRSSAIRRRRRETASAQPSASVQASVFSNYNPIDIEELARKIETERYEAKTETPIKTKQQEVSQEFIKITKLAKKPKEETFVATYNEEADELTNDIAVRDGFFSNVKINFRGKLIAGVVAVTLLCLLILTIYNIVALSGVNARLVDVNSQITIEERYVNLAEYFSDYLKSIGDSTNPELPINYNPVNISGGGSSSVSTNWFDSIVSFFQQLFGWN